MSSGIDFFTASQFDFCRFSAIENAEIQGFSEMARDFGNSGARLVDRQLSKTPCFWPLLENQPPKNGKSRTQAAFHF
jgi:hypothetical protein